MPFVDSNIFTYHLATDREYSEAVVKFLSC